MSKLRSRSERKREQNRQWVLEHRMAEVAQKLDTGTIRCYKCGERVWAHLGIPEEDIDLYPVEARDRRHRHSNFEVDVDVVGLSVKVRHRWCPLNKSKPKLLPKREQWRYHRP